MSPWKPRPPSAGAIWSAPNSASSLCSTSSRPRGHEAKKRCALEAEPGCMVFEGADKMRTRFVRREMTRGAPASERQEHLELELAAMVTIMREPGEPSLQRVAAVHLAGHRFVLDTRNVAELVPLPLYAHRARI